MVLAWLVAVGCHSDQSPLFVIIYPGIGWVTLVMSTRRRPHLHLVSLAGLLSLVAFPTDVLPIYLPFIVVNN
ncbi:hypothetical protein F5B17DRAFT_423360 [Nemania serpens]|nr:hypothetical protein F5B17DRAFT_423360 [Nemania serpens]